MSSSLGHRGEAPRRYPKAARSSRCRKRRYRFRGLSLTAFFLKAETVCALRLCGVALVSADLDSVKRAVVVAAAVILAVLHCTSDMLVSKFRTHVRSSFQIRKLMRQPVCSVCRKNIIRILLSFIREIQINFITSARVSAT